MDTCILTSTENELLRIAEDGKYLEFIFKSTVGYCIYTYNLTQLPFHLPSKEVDIKYFFKIKKLINTNNTVCCNILANAKSFTDVGPGLISNISGNLLLLNNKAIAISSSFIEIIDTSNHNSFNVTHISIEDYNKVKSICENTLKLIDNIWIEITNNG